MYDLGSTLKFIRQKRGITQKELAKRINKSISAISSYESNAQQPPLDVIVDIALALNVSLDYLTGMDKFNSVSVRSLSPEQSALVDLLLQEFHAEHTYAGKLSQQQIILLQKMIQYFINK